jgi:hypothetical protein
MRSASESSEMSQARAKALVASARSPAEAVLIQLMNCRTIIALPAYATRNDTLSPLKYKINHAA